MKTKSVLDIHPVLLGLRNFKIYRYLKKSKIYLAGRSYRNILLPPIVGVTRGSMGWQALHIVLFANLFLHAGLWGLPLTASWAAEHYPVIHSWVNIDFFLSSGVCTS
jgi:hypothetical protein